MTEGLPPPVAERSAFQPADVAALPTVWPISVSPAAVAAYHRLGYAKVENVLTPAELAALQTVTDEFLELSRSFATHTDILDLEPGCAEPVPSPPFFPPCASHRWRHCIRCVTTRVTARSSARHSPEHPKLRRVKNPGFNHPLYMRMIHHPVIAGVVEQVCLCCAGG